MGTQKSGKKLARKADAVVRESKRTAKNVKANVKAAKKFVNAVTGSKKKSASKSGQSKKATASKSKQSQSTSKKSPSKKFSVPKAGKSSYKLKQLASGPTLGALFSELESNAKEIDKLKAPGQRWAFKITDRQSLNVFRSMESVAKTLGNSYQLESRNDLINSISFITIGEAPKKYREKRKMEQKELQSHNADVLSKARRLVGGTTGNERTQGKRNKSKTELLGDVINKFEATEKRLAALEKQIAKLTKPAKKKASKKKASKKNASKKIATKKGSGKKTTTASGKAATDNKRAKPNGKRNTKAQSKSKPKKSGKK